MHVAYSQQSNKAGNSCAEMVVDSRVQVPLKRQKCTRKAGYSHAQIQNGDIC